VPPFLTWHILKIIMDSLSLAMTTCHLNQSSSLWLFFDTLQFVIIMCLKLKEEITNPSALINLIVDDFRITFEWYLFPLTNIKREVCGVLNSLKKKKRYEKRKVHNMLSLMLDLRFKSLCLIPCILCF
jgi:hypothetical protein